MPKYLPAGLAQYVLNNFPKKSPPYHVTQDDVSAPLQRLEVEKITGHQSVQGRGGVITVKYLPAGLTQYVLNNFSKKPPPYHVTQDDVSAPPQGLEVEKITGHQSVRARGGVIAVL